MPRHYQAVPIFLYICFISFLTCRASVQPQAVRDPAAITVVQNAITALGGAANIGQISDCTVQGTIQNLANPSQNGSFTWETAGSEFNYTAQTSSLLRVVVSGHGTPSDVQNGVSVPIGTHVSRVSLAWHIPGLVLLNEMSNSNYSFFYVGLETLNGQAVVHVQTADNSDDIGSTLTPQDWYFNPASYLPVFIGYRIPDPMDPTRYANVSRSFGGFTQVNGVLASSAFANTTARRTRTFTITSVVFNSGLSPSTFDPPVGGAQ